MRPSDSGRMVKCTKRQIRQLKTALHWRRRSVNASRWCCCVRAGCRSRRLPRHAADGDNILWLVFHEYLQRGLKGMILPSTVIIDRQRVEGAAQPSNIIRLAVAAGTNARIAGLKRQGGLRRAGALRPRTPAGYLTKVISVDGRGGGSPPRRAAAGGSGNPAGAKIGETPAGGGPKPAHPSAREGRPPRKKASGMEPGRQKPRAGSVHDSTSV
jgi:hypothetical protein